MAEPATRTRTRTRTVAKNSLWLLLDALFSMAVAFGLSVAVARALEPEILGLYNYAIWLANSAAGTLSTGASLGMQRFAAERYGRQDYGGVRAVLRRGFRWQLYGSILLVGLGIAATLLLEAPPMQGPVLLVVLSLAPMLWRAVPAAGLAATERFDLNVLPSMAGIAVNLVLVTTALLAGWGLMGLTAALLAARTVDCALRFLACRKVLRSLGEADARETPDLDETTVDRFQGFVWRSTLLLLIDLIVWDRSEFLVLAKFRPLADLAFYSLAFNIVQQALTVPKMLSWSLTANFMVEQGRDARRVVTLSADALRYVSLLAAPLVAGLAALAPGVMPLLYGERYREAVPVLSVIAGLAVAKGLLFPIQDLLQMNERQSFLIRFGLLMAAVNLGLDFLLIPWGGAIGAAWANGIAQGLATFGMLGYGVARLGLRPPVGGLLRILGACLPMAAAVYAVAMLLPPLPATLLGIPLGAALYLAGLRVLRVLRPADVERLSSLDRMLPGPFRARWRGFLLALAPARLL